jgi:hypothetical protein
MVFLFPGLIQQGCLFWDWAISSSPLQLGIHQCTEEFTCRRIRHLGYREKLAFECQRLTDLSREPASGKIFILSFYYCGSVTLI